MPGQTAASGAARHLREQLKGALRGAEIGHAEADIGGHHAHQRHVRNIVALGDHLRAHQHVVIALAEVVEDGLVLPLAGHRVAIEARDARGREGAVQLLFHALAADAQKVNMLALALRALAGHLLGIAAVVAEQAPVALVISQGQRAVDALHALAAGAAGHEAGEAAPVEQHDGLLAALHALRRGPRSACARTCPACASPETPAACR